ncbi:MAG: hypothetical protein ACT4RN_09955 [Pseudonocardia sp.]
MIDTFEEHGEIAALWNGHRYPGRAVVCFDRHLDVKPLRAAGRTQVRSAAPGELAGLNRRLPVRQAEGAFGLDDFWTAAACAGEVERLVWVVPERATPGWQHRALQRVSLVATDERPDLVVGPDHLAVRLCGLRIFVVPWDRLASFWRSSGWPEPAVDVDLDWLVGDDPGDDLPPALLAELVRAVDGRVDSMTWSQRSGFIGAEHRHLGGALCAELGRRDRASSYLPECPWPAGLMRDIALGGAGALARWRADPTWLDRAPGHTHGLLGVLAVGHDDELAATMYAATVEHGVGSAWLAYRLGVGALAGGRPAHARRLLLDAAATDPTDTLATHGRILAALCLRRCGAPERALVELRELAAQLPLRLGLLRAVTGLAAAIGDDAVRAEADEAAHRLHTALRGD